MYIKKSDKCPEGRWDCFAYGNAGTCRACIETDFSGKCPFYKTSAQNIHEHAETFDRLEGIGRHDLIGKYLQYQR